MTRTHLHFRLTTILVATTLLSGCANFRKLGKDLKFIDETVVISARITNATSFKDIKGFTLDWDAKKNKVESADVTEVKGIGVFGFFVKQSKTQYLCAYSDANGDKSKNSLVLPDENDGTVSVESVTRKEAVKDAIKVQSFDEDHVSILSNSEVIKMVGDFLRN